ncbi:sugar phosphate isomerase/epimerase family protein [Thermodesulfobacteriota bacterium]
MIVAMNEILRKVQVNIPFSMLQESYLPRFLEYGMNPEIGIDANALDNFSKADFDGIAKQISERSLSVTLHAPFMDLSPGSPDPAVRSLTHHRYQQFAELFPVFQPKAVVCHSGWDEKRYWEREDEWVRNSMELWNWLAETTEKEDISLVMENVYEQDPQEFMRFFDQLKHMGFGFCLDTGHQSAFGRVSLDQWLDVLGSHIRQVHLHDNDGRHDDHLALGQGNVDFSLLLKFLKERDLEPPIVTMEPHREEDLWASLTYLEKIFPW